MSVLTGARIHQIEINSLEHDKNGFCPPINAIGHKEIRSFAEIMKNTTFGSVSVWTVFLFPLRARKTRKIKYTNHFVAFFFRGVRVFRACLPVRQGQKDKLRHCPTFALTAFIVLSTFGCNQVKTIENTEGNMTDRYTVDKEGLKHGEFKRFFGQDTLSEVSNYVHGLLHGTRTIYNQLGYKEIVEQYVNDTLHGPYQVFDEQGDVRMEGQYTDGVMTGVWKRYYPGGRILEEVTYKDNVENGPFLEYQENGKLKAKGQYLDGDFEHDTLYLYNDDGILERKMLCDRGICRTFWLAPGTPDEAGSE